MKVLHINSSDKGGGAAIACFRHCEAMRFAGIDAKMLVLHKSINSPNFVYSVYKNSRLDNLKKRILKLIPLLLKKTFKLWGTFSFPIWGISISKNPLVLEADIIYIHWVGFSMLTTKEIERILKLGKPVRWYMHDMNPITGGCHHSFDCLGYQYQCKTCKFQYKNTLGIYLSHIQYKKRLKLWNKYTNLEAYTPSKWLMECVKKSKIWEGHKVTEFPNVLNLKKYHPINKTVCRDILGLDHSKKIILFGAANIHDVYKGWLYLKEALNELNKNDYEAVIFGHYNPSIEKEVQLKCNFLGYVNDEYSLIVAYNAADVFVSPSLAENYPNVIMEAMACGLPCVGFDTCGIPDQIKHKKNGYLAKMKDSHDLANGIKFVCETDDSEYMEMKKYARKFVETVASYDVYKQKTL